MSIWFLHPKSHRQGYPDRFGFVLLGGREGGVAVCQEMVFKAKSGPGQIFSRRQGSACGVGLHASPHPTPGVCFSRIIGTSLDSVG